MHKFSCICTKTSPKKETKNLKQKNPNKQKTLREIEKELKSKGRRTVVTFTCFPVSSSGLISIQSLFFLNQVGILKGLFRECCVQAKEGHACFFSKVSLLWPLLRNIPSQQRMFSSTKRHHWLWKPVTPGKQCFLLPSPLPYLLDWGKCWLSRGLMCRKGRWLTHSKRKNRTQK